MKHWKIVNLALGTYLLLLAACTGAASEKEMSSKSRVLPAEIKKSFKNVSLKNSLFLKF
jgi:hypothetical protein